MTTGKAMHTASADVRPVYAVVGHDRLLRQEALEGILRVLSDEMDTLGPTRVDGTQAQLADVLDEVRTSSLLGGRRVMIVDDADAFITDNRQVLERYCSTPSESGCLILACNTLASNTRLCRIIGEHGKVIACETPKGRAVVGWIANRCRRSTVSC